ncbi:uncharacterized protein DS421_13g397290 [Arachis hypogaea]|nr:uncharacterized protein DS421_13g397290 [Arachis hypogaea]
MDQARKSSRKKCRNLEDHRRDSTDVIPGQASDDENDLELTVDDLMTIAEQIHRNERWNFQHHLKRNSSPFLCHPFSKMLDKDQLGALRYDRYVTNGHFHHNGNTYPLLSYFAYCFFLYPTSGEIFSYEHNSSSFRNFSCCQNLVIYLF